ncbi:unnamed protein product, partial [Gordionus sp. m RMFG-2023]
HDIFGYNEHKQLSFIVCEYLYNMDKRIKPHIACITHRSMV